MILIGLTGGIASGKTTVAAILREKGAVVIDADKIGHEVLKDLPVREAVEKRFGPGVLDSSGEIDRSKLAGIVFGDLGALRDLEATTHPRIYEVIRENIASQSALGNLVVLDAPLLVETMPDRGRVLGLSALVVIAAFPEDQLERMISQRGMSEQDAKSRIAAQAHSSQKLAAADYVIHNSGTIEELRRSADVLWSDLWANFG